MPRFACLALICACSTQPVERDRAPTPRADDRESADAPTASCTTVLMTAAVPDARADLRMTVDGKALPLALDPTRVHRANQIWARGAAPTACGAIKAFAGREPGVVFVGQLVHEGEPTVRLQLGGVPPGVSELYGADVTGMVRTDGPTPRVMRFTAGKIRVDADTGVGGEVTVEFLGGSGVLVGSGGGRFELSGRIRGTFRVAGGPEAGASRPER